MFHIKINILHINALCELQMHHWLIMMHDNTCFGASIPRAFNTGTCISRLWQWAGWPILVCSPTQEPSLATAKTRKTWKKFWSQTEVNPTQKVEIIKEKIADMHGFILTYSMLQRRDLWALGSRNFEKKNWEKRTGFKLRKKQTNN